MPDYGHELQFGYFLSPDARHAGDVLDTAQRVEKLGFDLIGIQDHPYIAEHLDTYSLISAILTHTRRVRVFPDVTNMQVRSPALVAKAAATMDQLSGGRFELGIGAGAFNDRAVAMGAIPMSPGDRVDAIEESIAIVRALWSGNPDARVNGVFHQLLGLEGGPAPAHEMQIWLGASGQRMLRLIGQAADGWIIPLMQYMSPAEAAARNEIIDASARSIGRDPAEIRRIYNCDGRFTDTSPQTVSDDATRIDGPVDHWVDVLTHHAVDFGFSTFLLTGPPDDEKLSTFINEVAPQVRSNVEVGRLG